MKLLSRSIPRFIRPRMLSNSPMQREVDALEAAMRKQPAVECPLVHRITPGLYTRQICMPAGTLVVSKIHRTEHPFVILDGEVSVWTEETGVVKLKGPHVGITKPGTRRVLYVHQHTTWLTFHPSAETDLAKLEAELIEPRADGFELPPKVLKLLGIPNGRNS